MTSLSDKELVKPGRYERLPSLQAVKGTLKLGQLVQRTERSAAEVREYNKTITPDHREQFYMGGMNAIAEKFWHLARNKTADVQEIKIYADLLHDHFEQRIKMEKNALIRRNLELLEAKVKAVQELANDQRLPDAQYFQKFRRIMQSPSNGRQTTPKLLEEKSS